MSVVEQRYPFVAVDCTPEESDIVGGALFELGATGVEERDDATLIKGKGAGKVTLVASFETKEDADEAIVQLEEAVPEGNARLEEVVGDAWRDAWKEHFAPFALTAHVTVVPPWGTRPGGAPGVHLLELEPGRAFGTGLHSSTSLISEMLDERSTELPGVELLDVGTGSGILSLVALLFGAKHALAIDIDPEVVDVVRENAERNKLQDRIEARAATVDQIDRTYPWVLANIEARVLGPIAEDLRKTVAPSGTLILSGILGSEHDAMVARYESLGLRHTGTKRRGDAAGEAWVAIAFQA